MTFSEQALETIRRDGPISVQALARMLGTTYATAEHTLNSLHDSGLVVRWELSTRYALYGEAL